MPSLGISFSIGSTLVRSVLTSFRKRCSPSEQRASPSGTYILHEFTPAEGKARDEDYPPVAGRIEALIAGLPADDKNWFWDFAASLLIAYSSVATGMRAFRMCPDLTFVVS